MLAKIVFDIEAKNENESVTVNYDKDPNLWAEDLAFLVGNFEYDGTDYQWGDDNVSVQSLGAADLASIEFEEGKATDIEIGFNFYRDPQNFHEPFEMSSADMKDLVLQIVDEEDVEGLEEDETKISNSVKFYYGNIYSPDIYATEDDADVTLFVEVYCKDGSGGNDCNYFGLTDKSEDRMDWWKFAAHTGESGNIYRIEATEPDVSESESDIDDIDATEDITITYDGTSNSYKTKVEVAPDSWLSYHRYIDYTDEPGGAGDNKQNYFYIEWNLGGGEWSGTGELGDAVDEDSDTEGISRQNFNRRNW